MAVATTGAAGPEPHDGAEPGTVCLGAADAVGEHARTVRIEGERSAVTAGAVDAALDLLAERLAGFR
jgi:nicotinamide-nucleotide amidase